jgi:hypothetical protein
VFEKLGRGGGKSARFGLAELAPIKTEPLPPPTHAFGWRVVGNLFYMAFIILFESSHPDLSKII